MSLFDVIKYPLSVPPTREELLAVPEYLFRAWIYDINPTFKNYYYSHGYMVEWLGAWHFIGSDVAENELLWYEKKDVERLRKMLLEYEA